MTQPQLEASNSLFTESIVRWHIGDWEYLVELAAEDVAQHSEKCLIAMFKATALFQQGVLDAARTWVNQAIDWGANPKMLARLMLSGAHNSLGRAALLAGRESQAQSHIKEAMRIGSMELDDHLLYPARLMQQKSQINANAHLDSSHPQQEQPSLKPTKEQLQTQQQLIKEKINQAKQARVEKNYCLAKDLLSEILKINPNHLLAIKEGAALHAAQQQWMAAVAEYDRLLKNQTETENAILARSLMKKNADLLHETISDLEHAKGLGFFNSKISHQLGIAYRDNQQWEEAESTVRELCNNDPEYLRNLPFSTFVADLLRKRKKTKEAYGLLKVVIDQAKSDGQNIPLSSQAILEELQRNVNSSKYVREASRYYYDAIYARSEKYQADSTYSVYLPVWDKVVALLKQEKVQGVLDVGCGPGQFAEYITKKIPKVNYIGIDYSKTAIETAQLRCPHAEFFVQDLMHEDALSDFKADVFLILEVLEHIEKDIELIERIPNGQKVIFSVPNMDSFGHVRFFKDENAIFKRYKNLFDIFNIETILLGGRSKIHLAVASRKF